MGNRTVVEHNFVESEQVDIAATDPALAAIMGPLKQVAQNPLAKLTKRSTGFGRQEIVSAFNTAFEMIGGVPRLAVWGDANPGDFYKLYAKLLPSSSQVDLTGEQKITIEHILPRPHDYKADIADANVVGEEDEDGDSDRP